MGFRVVIIGLGDTGLRTAFRLAKHCDVTAIAPNDAHISGQELGLQLARPDRWLRDYLIEYPRYRKLDGVRRIRGHAECVDPAGKTVSVRLPDGSETIVEWDALVIASGVRSGFWRAPTARRLDEVRNAVRQRATRFAAASEIAVIGGGASGVSAAVALASSALRRSY